MRPTHRSLHVYTNFDSTVVLQDTGDTLLAHEMGEAELNRIDCLPKTVPGQVSLRKAEDMKWNHIRLSIQEAADILVDPSMNVLLQENQQNQDDGAASERIPFSQRDEQSGSDERSYRVHLDPGFKQFHQFCQEHDIPITIVSIGIQPLIEEMLNRYLGHGHGIVVRANGLTTKEDGSWKVIWRDSRANDLRQPKTDHILWCGDGSSDFPAALTSDIVFARQNTSLEKLLRANQIQHQAFTTFDSVRETVSQWIQDHSVSQP
ncbi:hypothetical protein BGX27_011290 [Mortierella sp. AM989]|nr:hypothetical protein BGX27_011290 [Mortierella sp. AM989]